MLIKFTLCLLVCSSLSDTLRAQRYRYLSTTDGHSHEVLVTKEENATGQTLLTLKEYKRYSQHVFHPKWGTERWELRDEKLGHDFVAQRTDDVIRIRGTFQHEPVQKEVDIGNAIWYNKLDHGLSDFAISNRATHSFEALRLLDDLDLIGMDAERIGPERITLGGQSYEAIKVKLTLNHFLLSKLWSAYCWFRASDGLFLRYQGANGKPGTPETVIELQQ